MTNKTEVFILTAEPQSRGNTSNIVIYGASSDGTVEITSKFEPYFYVEKEARLPKSVDKFLSGQNLEKLHSLNGKEVRKLTFSCIPQAEESRAVLRESGIVVYESDVRPKERFLMDNRVNGGLIIEGSFKQNANLLCYENPIILPAKVAPSLSICSLDIETSVSTNTTLSIGVHLTAAGVEEQKVFMRGDTSEFSSDNQIIYCDDEKSLLVKFLKWFSEADPDVLIGWNVIGFDLSFLNARANQLGVALTLGRRNRRFSISERSGRFSYVNLPGRVVLDGPQLLRASFYVYESYSLENVSRKVLGEGKLIESDGNKAWEIERLFAQDKLALAAYNIKDAVLVSRIFEKLKLLELTIRRTELSGMLLDQVGMSTAAFDHFYLPRLHDEKYVAPDVGSMGDVRPAAGGLVMSPAAGVYDNVVGLDFQSLYPSIIRSFGIDPLAQACSTESYLTTPSGHKFSRTRSILPKFIGELIEERRKAKVDNNAPLSQAIKLLMNSFYGVMGSSGSRLYHPALPSAITGTGQWLLIESKRRLEEIGHPVIYGDTDSLFVQMSKETMQSTAQIEIARELAKDLTDWWKIRLSNEFGIQSYLQLDFKKFYRKFLVPSARQSEGGAKKRYAGLVWENDSEHMEFVGLEVVRSDSTQLARDFQVELYTKIFHGESVDAWIREFVAKLNQGSYDDRLIYRKRLHKPADEYGSSPPPYVRAAMLLDKTTRTVRYVMTKKGPVPIELKPKNPDYEHYIDRQLRPVADSILEVLGSSFKQVMSAQLRLFI